VTCFFLVKEDRTILSVFTWYQYLQHTHRHGMNCFKSFLLLRHQASRHALLHSVAGSMSGPGNPRGRDYGVNRGAALMGLSSGSAVSRSSAHASLQEQYPRGGGCAGGSDARAAGAGAGAAAGRGGAHEKRGLTTISAPTGAGIGGGARGLPRALVRGNVGVAEDANLKCRPSMEDRYIICSPLEPGKVFLGVFDGHGGAGAAEFAAEVIKHNLINELRRAERKSLSITEVLTNTYHETDNQISMAGVSRSSGCTAVTAYMHVAIDGRRMLTVANAGDSRAVLCRNMTTRGTGNGMRHNVEALSRDHKPNDPDEQARIQAAGGDVIRGRVMGMLAVSRALGDHSLKDFVVSTPEIRSTEIHPDDAGFILLACDGVWDVFSNEEAVKIIQDSYSVLCDVEARTLGVQSLSSEQRANFDVNVSSQLARDLVNKAIQKGSRDNVTCLICLC